MNETTTSPRGPANAIRWTARIMGTLVVGIFLALLVAESAQKGSISVASDRVAMMVFMLLTCAGLIMAWKWEGAGGALALGSVIVFAILGLFSGGKAGGTILICALYGIPAFLFLLAWWVARRQPHRSSGHTTAS